jgi:hypothetical protein
MDTLAAFGKGEAARAAGARQRVFDWSKVRALISEHGENRVYSAGLSSDLEWTGGIIWEDGKPTSEHYTFLASAWATPVLVLDDDTEIKCWRYDDDGCGWDCDTKWPDIATEPR